MKNIFLLIITIVAISCKPSEKVSGNYTYKTECMGVELDGSQTLKAWGNGRNRFDAVDQAKKNAVRDVLFKGIIEGKPDCNIKPVLFEVNVQENHEDYFNIFFADQGEYKNYVSVRDERIGQKLDRDRKRGRESVTNGIVVRVLRSELKQKMIKDGILKN